MIIAFDTIELRAICEDSSLAIDKYGIEIAKQLHGRLSDMIVAKNIWEVPVGNLKLLPNISPLHFKLDLTLDSCLFMVANNIGITNPNWNSVNRVKVINIDKCQR